MRKEQEKDIIISSRVRLARNAEGMAFPAGLDAARAGALASGVYGALKTKGDFSLYPVSRLKILDGLVLKEKRLISEDLLKSPSKGAVIINDAETISVMLCEEDHIRIQCILDGYNFKEAYNIADIIDDDISKKIRYAFGEDLGYLTACPTNVGTGMRASAMMFLPGLSVTGALDSCMRSVSRLNMTLRGAYGEGSESTGFTYQISNERTLGLSEQEIIDAVEMSVGFIADSELRARAALQKSGGAGLRDKIMRAYGVLTNAYKLESGEFMHLTALLKLGIFYNYIKIKDKEKLEKLILGAQPANLQSLSNKELSPEERDIFRANFVAKTLAQL